MPQVYSKPLEVAYHANRVSCASCCALTNWIAIIIVPYVVAVATGSLWTKEQLVREQPNVNFRHEVLVEAVTKTNTVPMAPLGWSTSSEINAALGPRLRPCELRAWAEDDELDGLADALQFSLKVPLDAAAGEELLSVSVLLGVDVSFAREFNMRMNGALHFQHSAPFAGKRWRQTGELQLRSREPQRAFDIGTRSACSEDTWMLQQPYAADGGAISVEGVLDRYVAAKCNDTVALDASPPLWTAGVGDSFEAVLTVRVPPVLASRRPGLVETLKLGFVQYLAMFIPIRAGIDWVYGGLVRSGVVAARMHHPVKQHRF